MLSRSFWIQALERAVKTGAQSAVALIGGDGLQLLDIGALKVLYIALLAMLASVLTSLGSAPLGEDKSTPSLVSLKRTAVARTAPSTTPPTSSATDTPDSGSAAQ